MITKPLKYLFVFFILALILTGCAKKTVERSFDVELFTFTGHPDGSTRVDTAAKITMELPAEWEKDTDYICGQYAAKHLFIGGQIMRIVNAESGYIYGEMIMARLDRQLYPSPRYIGEPFEFKSAQNYRVVRTFCDEGFDEQSHIARSCRYYIIDTEGNAMCTLTFYFTAEEIADSENIERIVKLNDSYVKTLRMKY